MLNCVHKPIAAVATLAVWSMLACGIPTAHGQDHGVYVSMISSGEGQPSMSNRAWQPLQPLNVDLQSQIGGPLTEALQQNPDPAAKPSEPVEGLSMSGKEWKWPDSGAPQANLNQLLSRVAGSLAIVLVACVGCLILLKRFGWRGRLGFRRDAGSSHPPSLKVVQTLALAGKASLKLVEVDGQRLLVGLDAAGIKSIVPTQSFKDTFPIVADDPASLAQWQAELQNPVAPAGRTE